MHICVSHSLLSRHTKESVSDGKNPILQKQISLADIMAHNWDSVSHFEVAHDTIGSHENVSLERVRPATQSQLYDPGVLTQFWWQIGLSHSSMSSQTPIKIVATQYNTWNVSCIYVLYNLFSIYVRVVVYYKQTNKQTNKYTL